MSGFYDAVLLAGFSPIGDDEIYRMVPELFIAHCPHEYETVKMAFDEGVITGFQSLFGDHVSALSINALKELASEFGELGGKIGLKSHIIDYQRCEKVGSCQELGFGITKMCVSLPRTSGPQFLKVYFKKAPDSLLEESMTVQVSY